MNRFIFNYFIPFIILGGFTACKKDEGCDFEVRDDVATSKINDAALIDIWENDNLCPTLFPTDTAQGFRIVENPKHGEVSLYYGSYSMLYYTPDLDYEGDDQFVYELKYTNGLTKQATVRIKVSGGTSCKDYIPIAKDDIYNYKISQITTNGNLDFNLFCTENDTYCYPSIDYSKLKITQNIPSNLGTLIKPYDSGQHFNYTLPSSTFTGKIVFKYQICDVYNRCSEATVTLNITD